MISNDPAVRELVKSYLLEAKKYSQEKDLADSRLKAVYDSVKASEDKLGITSAEFKLALKALLDYEAVQADVDKKTNAIETVDLLGL